MTKVQKSRVSIVGCGWYGFPLAKKLVTLDHLVQGSTRSPEKAALLESSGISPFVLESPAPPHSDLLNCDVLILNIPPHSEHLEWISKWELEKRAWIIFISSTGVHQSEVLQKQEAWVKENFKIWTILRFGGLLGGTRHPGKSLSGKKNLAGRLWPVNLIHLEDAVGITLKILENKITHEVIEAVSDEHHSREEFYQEYALRNGLPLPEFDPHDISKKLPIDNKRAKEIYSFKFSTMIGKFL